MKKLGKLNINPEKVMKNEELETLKGGSGTGSMWYCKHHEGIVVRILGCITSTGCDANLAWNACISNYPETNEMAGGCSGTSDSCIWF